MKQNATAFALLFPLAVSLFVLTFVPLVQLVHFSFTDYTLSQPNLIPIFDARNYAFVLHDTDFWRALVNTLFFFLLKTAAEICCAFPAALALNGVKKNSTFLAVFFLPVIVPVSAAAVIWLWFFDPLNGFFNTLLRLCSLPQSSWLYSEKTALISVAWFAAWKNSGYTILIIFVGLQSIRRETIEAAHIDGASSAQIVRGIIIPLLKPFFLLAVFTGAVNSVRTFSETNVLVPNDGPLKSTLLISNYMYNAAFKFGNIAVASAAIVLFFSVFIFFMLILKPQKMYTRKLLTGKKYEK